MQKNLNMVNINAELYDCLNILGQSYIDSIPSEYYEKIKNNRNLEYVSKYDAKIGLTEETFSKETWNILRGLDLYYWCTKNERKEKIKKYKKNDEIYLKEQNEKYNPDMIWKKNVSKKHNNQNVDIEKESESTQENTSIDVIHEKTIFQKIIKKMISMLEKLIPEG